MSNSRKRAAKRHQTAGMPPENAAPSGAQIPAGETLPQGELAQEELAQGELAQEELLVQVQALVEQGDGKAALELFDQYGDTASEVLQVARADALRSAGQLDESAETYRAVAVRGGEHAALVWRRGAECLIEAKRLEEAMEFLRRSLFINDNDLTAHYLLGQLLFSSTIQYQGICHARHLLEQADDDTMLATAENIYRFSMMPYEAYQVVRRRAELGAPGAFLGLLLCGAQGICDWNTAETCAAELQERFYSQGDFATAREIPLYNIARVADEAVNLAVAREAVREHFDTEPAFDLSGHWKDRTPESRIRLGLLSADFSSHPVIQLIIGLFEHLDKSRFELFAYDDGKNTTNGEQRLLNVVDKHVDVREVPDMDVAKKVYADGVDVLIDLMGLTTKNRQGVLALRPCPVTATFLGFPGTSGLPSVDYVITDPIITPDSSKPHYAEKLCRLPEVFMPNDQGRLIASNPVSRAEMGLPDDKVVFASFNRSFKLEKSSVHLWMRVLARVPNSVLWQKADEPNMMQAFREAALQHGVDPSRLIFAGNTGTVALHLARAGLADLGLDTLIYNGHTITSDLLWAGVPVVACRGNHFASRVSSSLLHAVGLDELVADTPQDMEDLAVALALNPARLRALREKLDANKKRCPLYDTERYTRHFETALTMMTDRARQGLPADHLDVPALPPRGEIFLPDGPPRVEEVLAGPPEGVYGDMGKTNALQKTPCAIHYGSCPMCGGYKPTIGTGVTIKDHPHWVEGLPDQVFWVLCPGCGHMYTNAFWDTPTVGRLRAAARQLPHKAAFSQARFDCAPLVQHVWEQLGGPALWEREVPPFWLDICPADGNLALTASGFGFDITAVGVPSDLAADLCRLGILAWPEPPIGTGINGKAMVTVVHDLECTPYPDLLLHRVRTLMEPDGFLLLPYEEALCGGMALYGLEDQSEFMRDPRRLHMFSRKVLTRLLQPCGFRVETLFPDCKNGLRFVLVARPCAEETAQSLRK